MCFFAHLIIGDCMVILKKGFLTLVFLAALAGMGPASADTAHDTGMSGEMSSMGSTMVPFHIAEIIIALVTAGLVWNVINATGQRNVFIYLAVAMGFFAAGSVAGYSPHLGWLHDHNAELAEVTLNTIGLALIALSFYKWKKMLG
jgi:hypothetical protein